MPPILGVALMAMITHQGKPLLNINEALTKGVAWPSLMLLASTLALGSAITNQNIGLMDFLSTSIEPLVSGLTPIIFVFFAVSWAAIQTNFSSGMVASSMITTIVMTVIFTVSGVNAAAVASLVGMMTAYAFATPPAMPCVAIAGSSGWTNTIQMMKYGFAIMVVSIVISVIVGYPLAALLMG
jgi:sodium-dependent dicarboxylate transporter 2/3/5